ncbi:MAG TPA: dihydrolipoyl dehydrogenase [Polyangiaceae bacterium]|nr:dihydrolipoyl dehydrogenase [Polyangiaceae bacterium]
MAKTYDAIVLGGGPGGYPAAIRLGQLKQKVVCVEMDEVGGVCLNWGCIPSKAIISASHQYEHARHGANIGIKMTGLEVDPNALQTWKEGIVKKLTGGVRMLLRANGAELLAGRGTLVGPHQVEVETKEGKKELLEAKSIVVATGSSTIQLPAFPFDGKQIIGAKEAVSLRHIPKRLLVIGGGIIGLELGTAYQKLGSELTVLEALPNLLNGLDPEAATVVERRLVKTGAKIFKNAKALGAERQSDGSLAVRADVGGKTETFVCDVLLVAVGMKPNSRDIGLEKVGVKVDQRGFIPTDAQCRTNVPSIYAVGDVSGAPLLAHKATKEGEVAAEVIAGHKAAKDWVSITSAVFTDPEIGAVGLTEAEAREKGYEPLVGKMPFSASGRAMAVRETDGFVKVVADKKTHQILGWHIVGPSATDMISEGALSIEMAAVLEDVALTVHPHPTLGEAVMVAAQHALGQAIDILNK